ncbi:hypothetical protein Tco_0100507 [Tanacetum coccineum]
MDHYIMKALWIYWNRGDDEVELTDEESFDDEDEIAEVFIIDTNIFNYKTPLCSVFNEFNYLLKNKDVPWVYDKQWLDNGIWKEPTPDYEWYEALEDCELKNEALRNNAIMEGFIKDDDDESHSEQMKRWNIYANYDDSYEINHEREELCEVRESPICNARRYMMIKYSFNNDDEYVAIKEDDYDDLTITRKEACLYYQEIFQIMDEGWMVTRAE